MRRPISVDRRARARCDRADALRGRGARAARRVAVLLGVVGLAACGKKAPPLPPILNVPQPPTVTARARARTVQLAFTVPQANTNGSRPAKLSRVLVYGFTGEPRLARLDQFFKQATLVAEIPVKPAVPPDASPKEQQAIARKAAAAPGVAQGEAVVVTEALTPALLTPVPPERPKTAAKLLASTLAPPLAGPPAQVPVRRYYVVGVAERDRRGPLSTAAIVPLVLPPLAPGAPKITYTAKAITVTWMPPAFVRAPVEAPATGKVLPGEPIGITSAASRYDVYEVPSTPAPPKTVADTTGDGTVVHGPPVSPLNRAPLADTTFTDSRMNWGARRCYAIRTVDTYGHLRIESAASPVTCVTLRDTFPPSAPRGLQAVASAGAISLIWEPNPEQNLAGYLVLRAVMPGGTLAPITPAPIHDTTYRDTTVKPGVRYKYAVVAVDTAKPPNRSALSNTVEETAR